MRMRPNILLMLFLLVAILLSGCGAKSAVSATATPEKPGTTPTLDLCAPEHIKDAANRLRLPKIRRASSLLPPSQVFRR